MLNLLQLWVQIRTDDMEHVREQRKVVFLIIRRVTTVVKE